ncbi:MAG: hypothetical protein U0M06_11865, partial [Clostridia bacterium]|nr:hypothetical protein [Clostridia bacterium]
RPMGSDGMRYDLVKDIENYLGIRLENSDIISKLRKLSESKIEYLDGFHIINYIRECEVKQMDR